jgi:large subunit ribosomal protein L35
MPKAKTTKAIAKRFKKSARGKVLFARAGKGHLLTGKSRKQKRNLRRKARVSPGMEKKIAICMA